MCAGCAMTLFIRLAMISFPNPEDTITVGTAGCGRLAISQAAVPFVYGNYGDQNAVASGLSRGLRLRFGDKPKDVVVMAGNVPLFTPPGTQAALVAGCARHLAPGGRLVAGFQLNRGYTLETYDSHCAAARLVLQQRWATWDGQPWLDGGAYAVSVHGWA